jgi:(p)ppGpp synthase/HD superfamily hydrolase
MFDPGIERAVRAAAIAHAEQTRKGSKLPYITHPVHVAMILVRVGASSTTVQAGLLHDVVEDCKEWTLERLESEFGAEVTAIVAELTEDKTKSWEERKLAAAEKATTMSAEGALVKAADQLHNLKALEESLESASDPEEVWAHFNGGRTATIEMATRLLEALTGRVDPRVTEASAEALAAIRG